MEIIKPKSVKERDTLDLLELVVQLHARAINSGKKEMHDSYVEARAELESRINEKLNGGWVKIGHGNPYPEVGVTVLVYEEEIGIHAAHMSAFAKWKDSRGVELPVKPDYWKKIELPK